MIKNRTVQLVFQTFYCTLGLVGFVASFGIFDDINMIRWDFYVHFTNVSNFFCIGVVVAELIQTIKKKDDSYVSASPLMKFIGILGVLLTFFVFTFMLAGAEDRAPQLNWRVGSICFHVVLPILYIVDWILFYERKTVKWYYPFASIIFPFCYFVFIMIQGLILNFDTSILIPGTKTPLVYPYFFLNIDTQGFLGVIKWLFIFFIGYIVIGYLFYGINRISFKKKKNDESVTL